MQPQWVIAALLPLLLLLLLLSAHNVRVGAVTERILSQRWRGEVELQGGQRAEMEVVLPLDVRGTRDTVRLGLLRLVLVPVLCCERAGR
jgi:hypothetical protein